MRYIEVVEADLYAKSSEWSALTTEQKELLLDMATEKIDNLDYDQDALTEDQENIFPWSLQTRIPYDVKLACVYEANQMAIGTEDELITLTKSYVKSESDLASSVSYDTSKFPVGLYRNRYFLSSKAWEHIYPYVQKSCYL